MHKSLTHRPFALLWSGQTISRLGDSLYRIAMAWWVLEKTGSAAAMGTVLIFSSVPMLLFLLIGGVITDRFPRLRVMLISDLLSGLVVAVVALLAAFGSLEVWHIYVASIFFGLVKAFFYPAFSATVPEITPLELLPSANSLTSLSQQAASIIGPAVAAAIVALGGTPLAFGLDAFSFFVSAACLLPLFRASQSPAAALLDQPVVSTHNLSGPGEDPSLTPDPSPPAIGAVWADLRAGYRTVSASAWLWITIVLFGFINATSGSPMAVALPTLVKVNLAAGVDTLGLLTSFTSAGYVIGAVWLGRYRRLRRRGLLGYLATLFSGVCVAVFGLTTFIPALAAAAFLSGGMMSIFGLVWTNTLQELVPRPLLGRVSSIDALGSWVLLPVGYAVAGWAADLVGAPLVFTIGGAATVLLALLGLSHPAIRGLD